MIKKEVIETETVDKTEYFLSSHTVPTFIAERTRNVLRTYYSFLEELNFTDDDYYSFFVFCFVQAHYLSNTRVPNHIIHRMIKRLQLSYLVGLKTEQQFKELLDLHR